MASKDLYTLTAPIVGLNTQTIASDTVVDGNTIDMQFFEGVLFTIQTGALTDGTYTPKLQDSPDGTNWTDVVDQAGSGSVTGPYYAIGNYSTNLVSTGGYPAAVISTANTATNLGYVGKQRYVRIVITSSLVTSGAVIGVSVNKYWPHYASNAVYGSGSI